MLSYNTIQPRTLELLKNFQRSPLLVNQRLVGGTALALQYGHRISIDLDFFGDLQCDALELLNEVKSFGNVRIIQETKNIHIYSIDDIKVDIVNYSYPWIDEPIKEDGIIIASPKDIAAMKLNAIDGRGSKKDFIDFYFLLQNYTLKEILEFYNTKYTDRMMMRALMSLSYFEDAELQQMPKMLIDVSWDEIKRSIKTHVKSYSH